MLWGLSSNVSCWVLPMPPYRQPQATASPCTAVVVTTFPLLTHMAQPRSATAVTVPADAVPQVQCPGPLQLPDCLLPRWGVPLPASCRSQGPHWAPNHSTTLPECCLGHTGGCTWLHGIGGTCATHNCCNSTARQQPAWDSAEPARVCENAVDVRCSFRVRPCMHSQLCKP